MTLIRLESFPFDSRYDGFDDEGYPVYDRAVGSRTLRDVFAHFFSDGVFSDTTYPFRLTKAASGLAVTVNPGVIIINGGWGILPEATTLTLATGTTAGVIKYAVFARYDNNDEHRTLYLRTDASSAGGAVPEPSTSEANVTEYRIGYITVPSNSTDLSSATVTNEVGTSKCPYAVPLFDIDAAEVLEDLRNDAQAAYDKYYELLASSVDDTTAGNLQNQINDIAESMLTQDDIDAQALRSEMGLGNTLGVLGVEYGGTGRSSAPATGLVCSFDMTATHNLSATASATHSQTITYSNVVQTAPDEISFSNRVLKLLGAGFYEIAFSGTMSGSGGTATISQSSTTRYVVMKAAVTQSGTVFAFPGAAAENSIFSALASQNITATTDLSGTTTGNKTVNVSKTVQGINSPFGNLTLTFPSSFTLQSSTSGENIRSTSSGSPFVAKLNCHVEIYRVLAL